MEPTTQPQVQMPTPVQNKSSIGSIIGTIVIIAVIILGGLYFWGKRVEEAKLRQALVTDTTSEQTSETDEAAAIKSTSSSDDLSSIEADLNSTNLDNLDAEIQAE